MIKVEKYVLLISNHNVISYDCDIPLKMIANQQKYSDNDTLIKTINTFNI